MTVAELRKWLDEPRPALVAAVAESVRAHVCTLRSRGHTFYGYALHPGEPYDIHSLVAVTNTESDIKVPRTDDQYRYYRYSVDEWAHWEHDGFEAVNALLVEANEQFRSMHSKTEGVSAMDHFEIAHGNALLDSIVKGLKAAKAAGVFSDESPFLVVWISDSVDKMAESVRRLNAKSVVTEFIREFG